MIAGEAKNCNPQYGYRRGWNVERRENPFSSA